MKRFLVLRLSSMGDVLLSLPVIRGALDNHSDLELIFVTRKKFTPYFEGIERLVAVPFDPEGTHKGISGLIRLVRELRVHSFSRVIDLHGILRTWFLDLLFLLSGHRIYLIRKHRSARRSVLSRRHAGLQVRHTILRYGDVFRKAGINATTGTAVKLGRADRDFAVSPDDQRYRIGIAPISKHRTKNWGLNRTAELIELIQQEFPSEIFLFGGREEQQELDVICGPGVHNQAGRTDPQSELDLVCSLDVFVSMDSANMHLAALAGVPVVSIWGATDPSLGFAPLYQPAGNALYADSTLAACRPCSVYGEIPCRRTDAPMVCMTSIKPSRVLDKIREILKPMGK